MKKYDRTVMSGGQIGLSILCVFLALILIAMIFVTAYVNHFFGLIEVIPEDDTTLSSDAIASMESMWATETEDTEETGMTDSTQETTEPLPTIDPTVFTEPDGIIPDTIIKHQDLVNILLVGQDRLPGSNARQRSDTMIVVSVNRKNKTITLTSFMRDMYVYIPGQKYTKMNAAYAWGGFPLLSETLLTNFGMHIDGCVEVDFAGFKTVIDALGGVDVNVTQSEATGLNNLNGWNLKPGVNRLDGEHALGYARVRKGFGDDYARTERQRKIVAAVLEKCKSLSVTEILDLMEEMLPIFATNMTKKQMINYVIELAPMISQCTMNQIRIPATGMYTSASISGVGSCLVPDLAKNQKLLVDTIMPK